MTDRYYLLDFKLLDDRKHYLLRGSLYNSNDLNVKRLFLNESFEGGFPDYLDFVPNLRSSLYKRRTATDKVCFRASGIGFLFFISPRAKLFFQDAEINNIVFIKTNFVSDLPFQALEGYQLALIKTKIDCVDLDKSELALYESGNIRGAEKIVLKPELMENAPSIFLLGRRNTPTILVHENLKSQIEQNSLTGFQFYPLDQADKVL